MRKYRFTGPRLPGAGFYAALRQHVPPVTLNLLIINVAIFLFQVLIPALGDRMLMWGAAWPLAVLHGQIWRLFTYMFLHGGAGHVFFNMLTLYFFGPNLETHIGSRKFLTFFLVCGLGGSVVHLLWCVASGDPDQLMIGASGALYGVLCANAFYFPEATVYLQFLFPIKMKYLVWIFGVMEFLGSVEASGSGISHITHLGGLLTALIWLFGPRWWDRFRGPGGPRIGRRRRRGPARVETLYDDPHWRLDQ